MLNLCDNCNKMSKCAKLGTTEALRCSDLSQMSITISKGNSKMGMIQSVSLPAGATCNPEAPCYKACYARRLSARRKVVRKSYEKNLHIWKASPQIYKLQVKAAASTQRFFRYHVSGDIPDTSYLQMMVEIANDIPTCNFLAFTKQYHLVNNWIKDNGKLPNNLKIIFSVWQGFDCPNIYALPEAHVHYKDGERTARDDAKKCGGNCTECCLIGEGCWNLKSGEQIEIDEH